MKRFLTYGIVLLSLFGYNKNVFPQLCQTVELVDDETVQAQVVFDAFSKYNGGITINNVAQLKVKVDSNAAEPAGSCSWYLKLEVDNMGSPDGEWEELISYSAGILPKPTWDIVSVRVRNNCSTPVNDGFVNLPVNSTGLPYYIIDLASPLLRVGACVDNVNGPGNYIQNYEELYFNIDVRVKPGYSYNPGIYDLNLRFILQEN